ncbi:MAG: hypothetical protein ACTH6I_07200 [Vibrio litoralis]|uniref:hypothetical protein n=1 Tax=Vibrio litoralis TaxID=335972 RepID=UPI003F97E6E5
MSYIYNKETHTDYSNDYMNSLGIDAETQDSILAMRDYDYQKLAAKEQEWVRVQLSYLDELEKKLIDGDNRATMTAEEISTKRIALRDYVTNENGTLRVNGERP